jgi:hypothetical protein
MSAMRNIYKILVRKPQGRGHLGDIPIDGKLILKWILKKYG